MGFKFKRRIILENKTENQKKNMKLYVNLIVLKTTKNQNATKYNHCSSLYFFPIKKMVKFYSNIQKLWGSSIFCPFFCWILTCYAVVARVTFSSKLMGKIGKLLLNSIPLRTLQLLSVLWISTLFPSIWKGGSSWFGERKQPEQSTQETS